MVAYKPQKHGGKSGKVAKLKNNIFKRHIPNIQNKYPFSIDTDFLWIMSQNTHAS